MTFSIRLESPEDAGEVAAVDAAAFGRAGYGGLSAALRASGHHRPRWSFVAVEDGAVVGHTMVGTVYLDTADGRVEVPTLSPLAVAPTHQRRGIGRALVAAAVAAVEADGEPLVVLEGSPWYYGRLGFEDARVHGITVPLPDWAPPQAGQLRRLSGYRPMPGAIVYPPEVQAAHDAADDSREPGSPSERPSRS